MHLNIDFYSKYKVSVDQNLHGLYQNNSEQFRSLLLISTFLVRIYLNFDSHPVGKLLSCLLRRFTEDDIHSLIIGKYKFPNTDELGELLDEDHIYLDLDLDLVEKMIFYPIPELVSSRWLKGKHGFYLTLSPCVLNITGFSVLGIDINYFAFQAIFAAIHNSGKSFLSNKEYLINLSRVITSFSNFYQQKGAPAFIEAESFSLLLIKNLTSES